MNYRNQLKSIFLFLGENSTPKEILKRINDYKYSNKWY
jgi:hypothetical protein